MSRFELALKAFQQAEIAYEDLLTVAAALAAEPDQILNAAKQVLENDYRCGKLSEEFYHGLLSAMQDETRLVGDQTKITSPAYAQDDVTSIVSAPAKSATVFPASSATQTPTSTTESLLQGLDPSQPRAELTVGSTLKNRFVLEELLGVGGMGMVFKATDLRKVEASDKEPFVALKVLNQDFQFNPMALVALQRETKRAQTLSHPNIIKVYDFDRDGSHVFMSMEYLQGRPLSHLIREHVDSGLPFKKA